MPGSSSLRRIENALRLYRIEQLHQVGRTSISMTTGYCAGCEYRWPCRTVHLASGYEYEEDEERWCPHWEVAL